MLPDPLGSTRTAQPPALRAEHAGMKFALAILCRGVALGATAATQAIVVRRLSAENLGFSALVGVVCQYLVVFATFGANSLLVSHWRLKSVEFASLLSCRLFLVVVLAFAAGGSMAIAGGSPTGVTAVALLFLSQALAPVWIFQCMGEEQRYYWYVLMVSMLQLALVAVCLDPHGPAGLDLVLISGPNVVFGAMLHRKFVCEAGRHCLRFEPAVLARAAYFSRSLLATALVSNLYLNIIYPLIAVLVTARAVAEFRVVSYFSEVTQAFVSVTVVLITRTLVDSATELGLVSSKIFGFAKRLLLAGIMLAVLVWLTYPLINSYFFDGKYPGLGLPAALMTLARTVAATSSVCVVVLTARRQLGGVLRVTLITGAAGLAANTALVYLAGVTGGAVSTLGLEILGSILFLQRLHRTPRLAA